MRLPQGQIATRPKVNAALSGFQADGLIEPIRASLRLLDLARLRALAEQG